MVTGSKSLATANEKDIRPELTLILLSLKTCNSMYAMVTFSLKLWNVCVLKSLNSKNLACAAVF